MKLILSYVVFYFGIVSVLFAILNLMGECFESKLVWSFVLGFILFFSIIGMIGTMEKDEVLK